MCSGEIRTTSIIELTDEEMCLCQKIVTVLDPLERRAVVPTSWEFLADPFEGFEVTTLSAAQLWNKAGGDGYEVTKAGVRNLLWSGDTDGNRQTVFSGPTNDVDPIFFDVMSNVANVNFVPNYILNNQYLARDVNMDGKVIFQSGANEVDTILFMVLSHPLNVNYLPSYIIVEQLP